MSDTISRQAAIDIANDLRDCISVDGYWAWTERLTRLPSVQPQRKTDEFCHDCKEYDQEKHCCPRFNQVIRKTLSEQPEIIRCKDCKYWREHKYAKETKRYIPFCGFNAINTKADDYCRYAERRTDEQTD